MINLNIAENIYLGTTRDGIVLVDIDIFNSRLNFNVKTVVPVRDDIVALQQRIDKIISEMSHKDRKEVAEQHGIEVEDLARELLHNAVRINENFVNTTYKHTFEYNNVEYAFEEVSSTNKPNEILTQLREYFVPTYEVVAEYANLANTVLTDNLINEIRLKMIPVLAITTHYDIELAALTNYIDKL